MARSNNNNKLKAFVRFDGSGRIIPSSLIVQAFKPAVGNYKQINSKECCLNNECRAAVYGDDWIVIDVEEVTGGIIFTILTNPFENFTLQAQLINAYQENCTVGNGIGEIVTIGPDNGYELAWFVPDSILFQACGIQVRHVCGQDFYSGWTYWD